MEFGTKGLALPIVLLAALGLTGLAPSAHADGEKNSIHCVGRTPNVTEAKKVWAQSSIDGMEVFRVPGGAAFCGTGCSSGTPHRCHELSQTAEDAAPTRAKPGASGKTFDEIVADTDGSKFKAAPPDPKAGEPDTLTFDGKPLRDNGDRNKTWEKVPGLENTFKVVDKNSGKSDYVGGPECSLENRNHCNGAQMNPQGNRSAAKTDAKSVEGAIARATDKSDTTLSKDGLPLTPEKPATETAGTTPPPADPAKDEKREEKSAGTTPPAAGGTQAPAGGEQAAAQASNEPAPERPTKYLNRDESNDIRKLGNENNIVGDDEGCELSSGLGHGCSGTKIVVTTAKVTNAVTQAVGSTATQVMGQLAQQKAMQSGSQADMLEAAAETQVTSGKIQVGTGALNAALGAVQIVQSVGHSSSASKFKKESTSGYTFNDRGQVEAIKGDNRVGAKIASLIGDDVNTITGEAYKRHDTASKTTYKNDPTYLKKAGEQISAEAKKDLNYAASTIGRKAAVEQGNVAKEAMAGGMMSLVQGAGQMVTGGFNIAAGNTLKDAANKLRNAQYGTGPLVPLPGFDNSMVDQGAAPRDSTVITGDGKQEIAQAESEDDEKLETPDIGRGHGRDDPTGQVGQGPAPGKFAPGGGGGGSPGGGGGGLGGGSTSPASAGGEDPSSKYADSNRNPGGYDTGGGAMMGGGGGGGGGDKGPDLSGLLAQFLPKKEDDMTKNGILDFGGRDPASEGAQGSLLDRNANIFKRIHETYQEKHQRGFIGTN